MSYNFSMTLNKVIKVDKAHDSANEEKKKSESEQKNTDAQVFQAKHPKDFANTANDKLIKAYPIQLLKEPQRLKLVRAESSKYDVEAKTKTIRAPQVTKYDPQLPKELPKQLPKEPKELPRELPKELDKTKNNAKSKNQDQADADTKKPTPELRMATQLLKEPQWLKLDRAKT